MDYIIGIHYKGPITQDIKDKGNAFVQALGLEVNGDDGAVYTRKVITEYEDEDVDFNG